MLLTRPAADAGPLTARIKARGHDAVNEPLLDIRFLDNVAVDLSGVQALAFTSANGVRALARAVPEVTARDIAVFAVGAATEGCARHAGFTRTQAGDGDVESLARVIAAACDAKAGTVLHIAGRERAGDLVGLLRGAGLRARRVVLYAADAVTTLSTTTIRLIAEGAFDDVMIFSPRTARQFVTLMRQAGLADAARRLRLLALSPRVAGAAGGLDFGAVMVARRADQDALLDLLGPARDPGPGPDLGRQG